MDTKAVMDSQHDLIAQAALFTWQKIASYFHIISWQWTLMIYIYNGLDAHGSHKCMNA